MIVVDYQAFMNAKPDEKGYTVLKGKDEKGRVYVVESEKGRVWGHDPEQCKRSLEHA